MRNAALSGTADETWYSDLRDPRLGQDALRLLLLGLLAVFALTLFITIDVHGDWTFILAFRGVKLCAMVLVAYAIAVSSVLFQTITHNHVLTPSLIGFDALYALIQALAVLGLGEGLAFTGTNSLVPFVFEVAVMVALSCLLFHFVFLGSERNLHKLILAGMIFGLLFRSLANFVMRLIDPNEFLVLQDRLFASFNFVEGNLIWVSATVLLAVSVVAVRMLPSYDVLALGRDTAISLGVNYRRTVMRTLALIAVMVSVSTALVGPITFLGILVSNLAYRLMASGRHRMTLPAAVFIAIVLLVGGQAVLEHVLDLGTSVSVVIEFTGGLIFLYAISRKSHP